MSVCLSVSLSLARSLSLSLSLCLPASLPISSLDYLCSSFDEEDDEWCDEEFPLLDEETAEQYLHDNVTGIEGATPTPKRRRVARDAGLAASLSSGHYPVFLGMHGPSQDLNPKDSSPFHFLSLLWPASLCTLIAMETNRYVCQKRAPNWHDTGTSEIWTFLYRCYSFDGYKEVASNSAILGWR